MFEFIQGLLTHVSPLSAVIETQGMGYRLFIPASVFPKLPQINEKVRLYTSFVVREFSHTLYGFLTLQDRDLFEVLMSVKGIGPKLALNVISHMDGPNLQRAISQQDIPAICRIPGIGKKTAERLIIEMRDKLSDLLPPAPADVAARVQADPRAQAIHDAMSALINLGYNQIIAQKAIKKTLKDQPEEADVDLAFLITHALKNI